MMIPVTVATIAIATLSIIIVRVRSSASGLVSGGTIDSSSAAPKPAPVAMRSNVTPSNNETSDQSTNRSESP
jgi:hypothetical protein